MKRSEINALVREASEAFAEGGWALPPSPKWDVTDFGLGDVNRWGLVLVNLAEEPEYCEKLMFAREGMVTPSHYHRRKKEDIICRRGTLAVGFDEAARVAVNGEMRDVAAREVVQLPAGWRVTLTPEVWHAFWPVGGSAIIGEVSTANDDANDNFFADPNVGRFPEVEEDERPVVRLVSDGI